MIAETINDNLNWGVKQYMTHFRESKKYSKNKWNKLSKEEKEQIQLQHRLDLEFFKRNQQIIISDQVFALLKKGNKEIREKYNPKIHDNNDNVIELSYQRVNDKTYAAAYYEEIDPVGVYNRDQLRPKVMWGNIPFKDWYFSDTNIRYQKASPTRYKIHKIDENSEFFNKFVEYDTY
jgi:hypothetical protein